MAALTKDAPKTFKGDPVTGKFKVIAADDIFQGALLMQTVLGIISPHDGAAASIMGGFAMEAAKNSAGAEGDMEINVAIKGNVKLVVAGSGSSAVGVQVYATDDGTYTTTVGTNALVGRLWIQSASGSTTWYVSFEATGLRDTAT